ncbi:hypothetical protein BDY21DRAFT_411967 [Lineolata rhizophorae]|uniref:Uncharacterized protein n=1 Tax=Lineolata rhizophorae TaxID=578093 RepID=A0A6A6P3B1_9PEZI|nr:hypothetical protein BDY21DRAFT_411967 [Lineolata rhizophorae]
MSTIATPQLRESFRSREARARGVNNWGSESSSTIASGQSCPIQCFALSQCALRRGELKAINTFGVAANEAPARLNASGSTKSRRYEPESRSVYRRIPSCSERFPSRKIEPRGPSVRHRLGLDGGAIAGRLAEQRASRLWNVRERAPLAGKGVVIGAPFAHLPLAGAARSLPKGYCQQCSNVHDARGPTGSLRMPPVS